MTQESAPDRLDPADPAASETSHPPDVVQSLKQAMRRARFDDAERVGVLADLRATKIGRLELLQDALKPLLAQVPADVDMFDVGIMPGPTPRLFIDMIGFVEMARDARAYRFLQDTRHNRVTIAETANIARMVDAVTDYVARRLLEREKALASDTLAKEARDRDEPDWDAGDEWRHAEPRQPDARPMAAPRPDMADAADSPGRSLRRARRNAGKFGRAAHLGGITFAFIIDLLGAIAFFSILAFAGWLLWNHVRG